MKTSTSDCLARVVMCAAFLFQCILWTPVQAGEVEAPFGDKVGPSIVNYNRASPHIGSAGLVRENGLAELRALGFRTIVDLRMPTEGIAAEQALAMALGLQYINIAVSTRAPTFQQALEFTIIADNPANYPLLVHCVTANRAGAMWALYRYAKGFPADIALEEGRTLGLRGSREKATRQRLGLP